MISKEKQKAILEAMLFVSTEPVPLNKMLRKLKNINRKLSEGENSVDHSADQVEDIESFVDVSETVTQTVVEETLETQGTDETSEVDSDNISEEGAETEEDVIELETDSEDQDEFECDEECDDDSVDSDEDDSSDIMQQLMQKQKELEDEITNSDVKALLKEIQDELALEHHGVELVAVAKGYQIRSKYDVSQYLKNEKIQMPTRFSPSSLETLAIVAYQQPVTRNKVEEVRGVDSGGVMKTLLDKGILRVVGRSDEPGKPLIYGTTKKFLEIFGLENLKDLPSLQDYHSLMLSQTVEDEDEKDSDPQGIVIDDLVEDDYEALSEAERAVLSDLDDSLKGLRKVEKNVLESTGINKVEEEVVTEQVVEMAPEEAPEQVQEQV